MTQVNDTFLVLFFHRSTHFRQVCYRLGTTEVQTIETRQVNSGGRNSGFVAALTMPNEHDDNETTTVVNSAAPSNVPPG